MRMLIINSVCGIRSTGRICTDIALAYESKGWSCKIAYGRESVPAKYSRFAYRIGGQFDSIFNALQCRLFDNDGFTAQKQTKEFLKWASEYNPDQLWIHNLHGYYINVELLFKWIKSRPNMKVRWTLHDCWAFTGHCCYFDYANCIKWKTLCNSCPQKLSYPKSLLFDCSKSNYKKKKEAFLGVHNMELITPSKWLAGLVKQSFLSPYDLSVKYNTVDLSVFKPSDSDFRDKHNLNDKFILLGVASPWSDRKGLRDFVTLSYRLDDRFKIVLVGLNKKQLRSIPNSIVGLGKTNSVEELVAIYSAADLFLNLTYEDNYPTTNLEAQACGTRCITYKTGGSIESVQEENILEQGDLDELERLIKKQYEMSGHK